ncbi:FliM/FliN family flagellar motor switch protein [Paracoccus sanguinis]|uniref:FliM/FliN family flagellar motor switch protein n=1 Tax=Paracoccus sanguinis TaxID=1545044 RepID=UPI000697DC49|nr:FliM/FliN family flagellar motor C-terminal domain-containing protein [Paracoccus sanguinis]
MLRRALAARRVVRGKGPGAPEADPPRIVAGPRPPDRAVAAAIARAADRIHGLAVFFDKVTTGHAELAEIPELLPEQPLISVVEGPGDRLGAVAMDSGLLTSLIEMQALGRVSARPAVTRRPTRTDGAICADFVSACLAELEAELAGQPGFEGVAGFRYASFLDDPRPLALMLEETSYRLVTVTLRAGDAGERDGTLLLVLPHAPPRASAPAPAADAPTASTPPASAGGPLAEAVRQAPIELTGVLCRRQITLGELRALGPGDRIALPPGVLEQATLETAAGQVVFRGRLGALGGHHALRLRHGDARPGAGGGGAGTEGHGGSERGEATRAGAGPSGGLASGFMGQKGGGAGLSTTGVGASAADGWGGGTEDVYSATLGQPAEAGWAGQGGVPDGADGVLRVLAAELPIPDLDAPDPFRPGVGASDGLSWSVQDETGDTDATDTTWPSAAPPSVSIG